MKRRHGVSSIAVWICMMVPAAFAQEPSTLASSVSYDAVWSSLGGFALQRFLDTGLAGAPALAEAYARVQAAEAAAREAGAERQPTASGRVSASDAQRSKHERRTDETGIRADSAWSSGVELQHTLDIWGRAAATARAAGLEAEATRIDQEGARAVLARDIVQAFSDVAEADARLRTVAQSLADARETLRLTQVRADYGAATQLDIAVATAELERLTISQTELIRSRTTHRARLAALVGTDPFARIDAEVFAQALDRAAPLPSLLNVRDLARRPDLRAIEIRAQAAGLRVSAARAALYPDISLSASIATSGSRLAHSFNAQYLAANIVASLTAPLVDGHRRRARIEAAQAEANRIAAEQGSALLRAAQEVIESQASLNGWVEQGAAAARRVAMQERVVRLLEERRAAGAASLLDVLRERAALIAAMEEVATIHANRLAAVARLLVSLGIAPAER
jgi:NodT family efflux transporter outer membrane factor (OMF) lipoprotein